MTWRGNIACIGVALTCTVLTFCLDLRMQSLCVLHGNLG
jgi:hypothetical protein